jgi:hypothetical protein
MAFGGDRRPYQLEWHRKLDVSGVHRPAEDPQSAAATARHAVGAAATRVLCGRIVDAVAYAGCYKVQFEAGCPPLPCVLAAQTSLLPLGARQANSLVVGSTVWAIVHPQLDHGVILGVEPLPGTDPSLARSQDAHGASRCGLRVDQSHYAVLGLRGNGGVVDWSAGRPLDGLAGEWGAIAETGVRVLMDSFMAQLGVDEATAVQAFYHDQLLRLAGYNLQVHTSGSEEERLDDRGEVLFYRGSTPFTWEHLGVLQPGSDPFRTLSAQASQIDEPHYGAVEPVHDDQQPFHRVLELGGYVGQGAKRMILLPPADAAPYRYAPGAAPAGVFEEQINLAGGYALRSADEVIIARRPAIPGPRRRKRPEDPQGDENGYKAAGLIGDGPAHEISGGPAATDPRANLQTAAAAADARAHAFNWAGAHGLHYHEKDWMLPEEDETPVGANQVDLHFDVLAGQFGLDRPAAVPMQVDHRYGAIDYIPVESYLHLLDDGGVALGDGYCSELLMTAGITFITAPGDVFIKAGRSINLMAGHDINLRAKGSIDLSASTGRVGIKAETDVQVLGGNGGVRGAVLIESKAPAQYDYEDKLGEDVAAGGVQIKSKSELAIWAQTAYLRTIGGAITLDADRGQQPIWTQSNGFYRYLHDAVDYFGTMGSVTGANFFSHGSNALDGALAVNGYTTILRGGLGVSGGHVVVAGGHVVTDESERFNGLVAILKDENLARFQAGVAAEADAVAAVADQGNASWQSLFATYWYGEKRPGDDATIATVGFSFRTPVQYRTEDFALYEDRWQREARLRGGAPAAWTERPVHAGSADTYPYPGKEKWLDEPCLREQDLLLCDPETGTSQPRDPGLYGKPKLKESTERVLDGHYAVII